MNCYSLNDITESHKISKPKLRTMINTGEILAVVREFKFNTGWPGRTYFIPESELKKLEHLKFTEPTPREETWEEVQINNVGDKKLILKAVSKIKGGEMYDEKYYETPEWKMKSRERMKLDNFKCQLCGSGKNLIVHHLTYDNFKHESMDDLVTLCKCCHENKVHHEDILRKNTKCVKALNLRTN